MAKRLGSTRRSRQSKQTQTVPNPGGPDSAVHSAGKEAPMVDKLYKIAEALNSKFPDGDDPFKIVTRLAEECGEVAAEVGHFEGQGVKFEKMGEPNRMRMAKELSDVIGAVLHLVLYYDLKEELAASVDTRYHRAVAEGLVAPLPD